MVHVKSRIAALVAIAIGFVSIGFAPAFAVDERVIDVVEVTWNGAPALRGDAKVVANVIDTEVNEDWKRFTNMFGDTKDRTISFKTGQILQTPIQLISKMPCTGQTSSEFMNSIRPEAYKRLGISDFSNRYLMVVSPRAGCIWSGRALVGDKESRSGTVILHDSDSSFVISHELGHTFGLGHSNFLSCKNQLNDGPWGENCKAIEYGGTIDVMGNVDTKSPLSTYHQWRMGLIEDSQVKQVWQSEIVRLAPSDFANGIKAIFIRDGKAAYWIEYRRKTDGIAYKPGLAIYRLDPPPVSAVISPNPEDQNGYEFPQTLGADVWLMNLDSYVYENSSNLSGSMTGLRATTFSGDVSISAVATESEAVVTIDKKKDISAPVPPVKPFEEWKSPGIVIVKSGFEDPDTAIVGYEALIDGVVTPLKTSDVYGWVPTYLNPFVPAKTVYLKDLPEGSYSFALRAFDIVGNKSDWSTTQKVVIDRADPVATNSFTALTANSKEMVVAWKGARDAGSGICEVNIVDEDGWILQSTKVKNAPVFTVPVGAQIKGTAQIFDCLGNGLTGEVAINNEFVRADKFSRSGKWTPSPSSGLGAMKCTGKCTASISMKGKFEVLLANGGATVSLAGKTIANVGDAKNRNPISSSTIDVGAVKKVIRISGNNFILLGLSAFSTSLGDLKELDRLPKVADESLADSKQALLGKMGFREDDFSQEWTVLPMFNGTTLIDPSLDLCNGKFDSEKDRIERRQVVATKPGSSFIFLSTEVVRYSSASAASNAQKELVRVLSQCQSEKGYKDSAGVLVPHEFKSLNPIPEGVVSEGNRVFVHTLIGSSPNQRTLLGFYQFNGDKFTGLYVMNADGFSDSQVAKWLRVAVTMSQRIQGR